MATMKALVKARPEPGLWLQDVPVPEPGINDVLIRIHKTSICGTDVHIYNWDEWARKTIPVPMHVGHEFVGRVAAVGANVHDFKVGDLVARRIVMFFVEVTPKKTAILSRSFSIAEKVGSQVLHLKLPEGGEATVPLL